MWAIIRTIKESMFNFSVKISFSLQLNSYQFGFNAYSNYIYPSVSNLKTSTNRINI